MADRPKIARLDPTIVNEYGPKSPQFMMQCLDDIRSFEKSHLWLAVCQKLEAFRLKNDVRKVHPDKVSDKNYGVAYGVDYACDQIYNIFDEILEEGQRARAKQDTAATEVK